MFKRLLRLAVVAAGVAGAWAHGFMSVPKSRNIASGTYCDQCQNAGGHQDVWAAGTKWAENKIGNNGVCGDRVRGENAGYHEGGGKYEQTVGIRITYYHSGDTVKVTGELTANHLGFLQYRICVLPDNSMGGGGERQHLTNACFAKSPPLPVEQNGRWGSRFYVSGSLGKFANSVKMPDIVCPRCVLRWYYITGNSCTPPGTPSSWADSDLDVCGKYNNPEEFWNCADIALLKKGEALPAMSSKKLKGELSTGVSMSTYSLNGTTGGVGIANGAGGNDPDPSQQQIDTDAGGDGTGAADGGGGGADDSIVSFQDVAISVVVGTGFAVPVVMFSPLYGTVLGLFAFIVALVIFMIRNNSESYAQYQKFRHEI